MQKTHKCHICGSREHLKKDCPKKDDNDDKKPCIATAAWKAQAPQNGESETKTVNGKQWHWCAHCGFWQLSHGAVDHKDPKTLKKDDQQPTASLTQMPTLSTLIYSGAASLLADFE